MAKGIYFSWKIPIAYFLAHSTVKHSALKNIVVNILQEIFRAGLFPKLIICDQGTNNHSAL